MELLDEIIAELFDNSKTLPVSEVPFSDEVRSLCEQNMCGKFGKSWTCPPAVASPQELQAELTRYGQVVVAYKVYELEDSFDWEGMVESARDFQKKILQLKKKIRKAAPELEFTALGAGSCSICETCTYEEKLPCKNPKDAIVSVEACGINVMQMLADNGMSYNNGPNTVTYVGALFVTL